MSSRDQILGKLRERQRPFPTVSAPAAYRPMVTVEDVSAPALTARFVAEALKNGCLVHQPATAAAALEMVLQMVGEASAVSCWQPDLIPLPGLAEALDGAGVERVGQDAAVRIGITGVDSALAATGSVVVVSGLGRYRAASLLPPVHIAILETNQILPDLESWWAAQRAHGLEQMREASNIVVISGPSRTADIAMQLVMGMHGPREMHLILIDRESSVENKNNPEK